MELTHNAVWRGGSLTPLASLFYPWDGGWPVWFPVHITILGGLSFGLCRESGAHLEIVLPRTLSMVLGGVIAFLAYLTLFDSMRVFLNAPEMQGALWMISCIGATFLCCLGCSRHPSDVLLALFFLLPPLIFFHLFKTFWPALSYFQNYLAILCPTPDRVKMGAMILAATAGTCLAGSRWLGFPPGYRCAIWLAGWVGLTMVQLGFLELAGHFRLMGEPMDNSSNNINTSWLIGMNVGLILIEAGIVRAIHRKRRQRALTEH